MVLEHIDCVTICGFSHGNCCPFRVKRFSLVKLLQRVTTGFGLIILSREFLETIM